MSHICRLSESDDVPDQGRTEVLEINVTYSGFVNRIERATLEIQ